MTCLDARDLFSARADGALAPAEDAALAAHLDACPECAREWRRFAATVGLLRAVEPARAPAGFVDRVLAGRRQPWPRRLARGLFLPWPVKLPLQAAAVVLVGGLAVLLVQQSSQREFSEFAPQGRPPFAALQPTERDARSAPTVTPPADAVGAREPDIAGSGAAGGAPAAGAPAVTSTAPRAEPPAASGDVAPAPEAPAAPATSAPKRAVTEERAAEPGPRSKRESALRDSPRFGLAEQEASGERRALERAAPVPDQESAVQNFAPRREAAATVTQAEARLAARDRAAAEREVRALVARLGGVVTGSAASLEIVLPAEAWDELTRGLDRLGTLRLERRPEGRPAAVRLTLRLTD